MDLSQLPPGNAPGLAYNSLQISTVVAFAVTYVFASIFLALRYIQAVSLVKKVELDLSRKPSSTPCPLPWAAGPLLTPSTQLSSHYLMARHWPISSPW